MDTQMLWEAVAEEFAVTSAATPPWLDPHPGGAAPLDEEYSRCLDPGRYRILGARAEAWVRALSRLGVAAMEEVANPGAAWREEVDVALDTAIRLRPLRVGAVPLLLGFQSLDAIPAPVVVIGAGEPAVQLVAVPHCGCDACDNGSESLLNEFDEYVLAVVTGDVVHVTTRRGTVVATGSGWSASGMTGRQKIEAVLSRSRAGRSRHRVVQGVPWG